MGKRRCWGASALGFAIAAIVSASLATAHAGNVAAATGSASASATSTLTTIHPTLAGRLVSVDIRAPAGPARAAVVLVHGFTRTRATMAGHAEALADAGVLAFALDLPYGISAVDNAEVLGELIALIREGATGAAAPLERIVLVGYSMGGLVALLAAASPGVVGYVGLDPIDYPGGEGLAVASKLDTPAVLVHGPPSPCNVFRIAESWTSALPALVADRLIENASHCDFESPTDAWCTRFCSATDPHRQGLVRAALLAAVLGFLPTATATVAPRAAGED
jgi:pimeloyl-ACP methyl ester carboxylesterase